MDNRQLEAAAAGVDVLEVDDADELDDESLELEDFSELDDDSDFAELFAESRLSVR